MDAPYPAIDKALLDALNRDYPHRCPNPTDTEREIWMKAGERRLVDKLTALKKRQDDNLVKDVLLKR